MASPCAKSRLLFMFFHILRVKFTISSYTLRINKNSKNGNISLVEGLTVKKAHDVDDNGQKCWLDHVHVTKKTEFVIISCQKDWAILDKCFFL